MQYYKYRITNNQKEFHYQSMLDFYWIQKDSENINWNEIALRNNEFLKENWKKEWIKQNDGNFNLIQRKNRSSFEVQSSNVFECFEGIDYVKYREINSETVFCLAFFDKDEEVVLAEEFIEENKFDFLYSEMLDGNPFFDGVNDENMALIAVFDYLFLVDDRHHQNWGFRLNTKRKLVKCLPLFDYDNSYSFIEEYFEKDNFENNDFDSRFFVESRLCDCSVFELAKEYIPYINLKQIKTINKDMFVDEDYYKLFKMCANDLGLKLKFQG